MRPPPGTSKKMRGGNAMNEKSSNYIELTADIVSAYVSNNSVSAGDIPALISQVHSALLRVSNGQGEVSPETLKPAVAVKKSITPELSDLPRGRQEVQIAQAPSAHAVQHDARALPREMGPAAGLPDGRAQICRSALATRQADGPRPAAPAPISVSTIRKVADLSDPAQNFEPLPSDVHAPAATRAWRASSRMRPTIDFNPLERCGVRCSRRPSLSNSASASVARMSRAGLRE